MASYNRVILAGNLTRDPELRFTQAGIPVCGFGLAVNRVRSKSEEVDFFDISAWRELGETIANYKKKGDGVLIEGRLQFRTWEAKDGSTRSKVDVVADNVQFLSNAGGRQDEPGQGAQQRNARNTNSGNNQAAAGEESQVRPSVDESDFADIPF